MFFNSKKDQLGQLRIDVLRLTTILEKHVENLQEEKRDLLNRLMSRNFEEFKTLEQPLEKNELFQEIPLEEDEMSAGEVLDIEE